MSLKVKAKKAMTTSNASTAAYNIRQEYLAQMDSENKPSPSPQLGQLYSQSVKGALKGTPLSSRR